MAGPVAYSKWPVNLPFGILTTGLPSRTSTRKCVGFFDFASIAPGLVQVERRIL